MKFLAPAGQLCIKNPLIKLCCLLMKSEIDPVFILKIFAIHGAFFSFSSSAVKMKTYISVTAVRIYLKKFREITSTVMKYDFIYLTVHSALKWEKSAISKVQKHIFYHFKNVQKSIFWTKKKLKTTKNAILNFFLVQKLIYCHFWNSEKCVFVLLKLHFFPILEDC